jgi:glutaredoxin
VTRVTIYSRPGCHLCDEMKAIVLALARSMPLDVQTVDISLDPALEAKYGLEIPVLEIDGRKAAKYRVSEDELRKILAGRSDGSDGGDPT